MTEVLRLAGIAILGAAMGAVLRAFGRKEAALVCEVACGLALLLRVLQGAGEALSALPDLFGRAGLSGELSGMLLRSAGIRDLDWVMAHTAVLHFCGKAKPWRRGYLHRFGILYKHYMELTRRTGFYLG